MIYIGIDPGMKGAWATIASKGDIEVMTFAHYDFAEDMNLIKEGWIDGSEKGIFCVLEKVHSMPGQGVASTFKFGEGYGYVKGVLEANYIPYQEISPQTWKKEFHLIGKDKKASIEVCKKLFPKVNLKATERSRVEHDGMAESLLLAEYARRIYKEK